ncbi:MAG TPA: MOSC domain-containing protein [Porticoccaceae bacterium]|nr:MOSC domain-containing protein [Porticoccaceae bacterium]
MTQIGTVASLWRYPVKSMRGEQVDTAFVGYSGVYGDRLFAFQYPGSMAFFPYFTGREYQPLLLYTPRFRYPEHARQPVSWAEAESTSVGITPLYSAPAQLAVDVTTPDGTSFAIDDEALIQHLAGTERDAGQFTLSRSDRAMTDCRPLSLIANQTILQLSEELGRPVDARRFRANIYIDWCEGSGLDGFAESKLVERRLRIGDKVVISIVARDGRCAMITYDPDSGAADPSILRQVTKAHERIAGVYAAVLVEGLIYPGDAVELI